MAANGAGQAPFVKVLDGPLRFIGRRDNIEPIIHVNLPDWIGCDLAGVLIAAHFGDL
jgi:hypothetical protein